MQPFGGKVSFARPALIAWLAVITGVGTLQAQEPVYLVDEVKAAFLYHFGTYVQWPTEGPTAQVITIAVLGAPNVVAQLELFLPGRRIQDTPVEVKTLAEIGDLNDEEILFIGADRNARLADLIEAVGRRRVLIVTDARDGLAQGAVINFQLVNQRLRFEVSLSAAENAGLMLSSRLLSAALRVETADCWFPCSYPYTPRIPNFAQHPAPAGALISHGG
jgi:hypothetical protein